MAEATTTRKVLRRAIASELGMPFFRRYIAGELHTDSGSTTTKIIDSGLAQKEGYWNGSWFFAPASNDLSIIRAYNATDHSFQLEIPMAATPSVGDKYEIHTLWNARDIHNAIEVAINTGARIFPETIVDSTQVFCEDKMSYDLTALASKPFMISRVYAEKPSILIRGAASGGAVGYLTIAEAASTLTGVTSSWLISIYKGTGMNQVRAVSSVVGQQVNVATNWTTAPDATSGYTMWNPTKQRYDWNRLDLIYTDAPEYPDTLYLRTRLPYYYGMRMRIEYLVTDIALANDASTTAIPKQFVIYKACAILHGQKLGDTKADRDLHFAENKRYEDLAAQYIVNNAPRMPATTIPSSESSTFMDVDDPLDWYGLR